MLLSDHFSYRPEIDGLRAIAVLVVVLFHAGLGCSGGFVGVDVFFVISGYLITSLVWRDLERGSFTFATFWERRARRIVPPLLVVTMATLIAGYLLLLPADFKDLGIATVFQSLGISNFYYWRDSGYFTTAGDERPLLHTWSLAVEEQFYLMVPYVLYCIVRTTRLRSRASLISLHIVGTVVSFLVSIVGMSLDPMAAFFLLPSRAWELLLGSLLAFLPTSTARLQNRFPREFLSLAGIVLILAAVSFYTKETPFPGTAALAPCGGAALFIWANRRIDSNVPTMTGTLLSTRPVVFIGLISYSLYLWHWPFFAFARYLSLEPLSLRCRLVALSLGFVFALLSWKFVETPFRKRRIATSGQSIFVFSGLGVVATAGVGLACFAMGGFPHRLDAEALAYANARFDRPPFRFLNIEDVRSENFNLIGVNDASQAPTVFIWGDSHAYTALTAFDLILKERGLVGQAATRAGTAPVLGWRKKTKTDSNADVIVYNQAVLSHIENHHIADVFLISCWTMNAVDDRYHTAEFKSSLLKTVEKLVEIGSRPWIVLDVPNHSFDVPKALSRFTVSDETLAALCERSAKGSAFDGFEPELISQIKAAGGQILDPKPHFLDSTGNRYLIQVNGIPLYYDANHMTTKGSKALYVPFLREALNAKEGIGRSRL